MSFVFDFDVVKQAIVFNTQEILPSDPEQLDQEIQFLVNQANQSGSRINHYIGFEISGQVHIGTGMMTGLKIAKLTQAGIKCHVWLADYHTWLNNKLDGKLETIRRVAKEYFGPVMLECAKICGADMDLVEIKYAQDVYNQKKAGLGFWEYMLESAKNLTLSRVKKSISIMGKEAGEDGDFGTLCYPVMQVADPFFMDIGLVHAGMDQRKCHVLMREIALKLNPEFQLKLNQESYKPIAMHHHLLLSLGISAKDTGDRMTTGSNEDLKMSKSKPDSAIWVHDSLAEIQRKLKQAYCPIPGENQDLVEITQEQAFNPILNWCQYLVYPAGQILELQRPEKFGGDKQYPSYSELEKDYFAGKIHPLDLKNALANCLSAWFSPIYNLVENNSEALNLVKNSRK